MSSEKSSHIRRPRLVQRLDEGVQRPLTLLSAPAGSGKTTLLTEWLAVGTAPGPVVRVTLDAEAVGPRAFWRSVYAAARTVVPELATAEPSRDALSDLADPPMLVVDDFQVVRSLEVAGDLDWLLERGKLQLLV